MDATVNLLMSKERRKNTMNWYKRIESKKCSPEKIKVKLIVKFRDDLSYERFPLESKVEGKIF